MSDVTVHPPLAFPVNFEYVDAAGVTQRHLGTGMTLRDYFAGQALIGLITRSEDAFNNEDQAAEWSYSQADAMLKARSA